MCRARGRATRKVDDSGDRTIARGVGSLREVFDVLPVPEDAIIDGDDYQEVAD